VVSSSNALVLGASGVKVGIGTTAPAATLEVNGTAKFDSTVTFAAGQAFPGTIAGVTAGSGLTGGGTSGTVTVGLTNACASGQILQWNGSAWACSAAGTGTITGVTPGTAMTGGGTSGAVTLNLDTIKVPLLSASNTFAGTQGGLILGPGGDLYGVGGNGGAYGYGVVFKLTPSGQETVL
jgi:uncharacterized repeat protein (TIGR03803 family)